MVLKPAYGRDYRTAAEALADWEAGKDFVVASVVSRYLGKLTSVRDYDPSRKEWEDTYIRYDRLTKFVFVPKEVQS